MPEAKLNILIYGAGAIGCFVGGHLAAAGHRVTLLGRAPLMDKIKGDGLTIQWPEQPPLICTPETATTPDNLSPPYDYTLITVKAPAMPKLIEQLQQQPNLIQNGYLVSLQNGIGNEETLAAAFGPEKVIAGTVTIPIQVPEPNVIKVSKAKGGLGLAPLTSGQAVEPLAKALTQAGLETPVYDDYLALKWSKLLLNIVHNASSAILDMSPVQMMAETTLFDIEIRALQEGVAVMKAQQIQGVKLPGYPVDWLARILGAKWLPLAITRTILRPAMSSGRGSKMPSLHIDLASGRTHSEVEALNGAIVNEGEKRGIPTPVNQALTQILSGIVCGKIPWSEYRHQPQKLLQVIQKSSQGN